MPPLPQVQPVCLAYEVELVRRGPIAFVIGFQTRAGQSLYTFEHRETADMRAERCPTHGDPRIPEGSLQSVDTLHDENSMAYRLLQSDRSRSTSTGETEDMAQQQPHDVLRRVQGEYIEMPGLRLTTAQAQRLWGLDRAACDALLGALVDAKFLFRTRDGAFVRSEYARTQS